MSNIKSTLSRLDEINDWLIHVLASPDYQIEPASSDASFRHYFRITLTDKTWILMDAPPQQEDTKPFIDIATFLYQHDIHVPKIEAQDRKLGFLLLSDFGDTAYLDVLNNDSVDNLYQAAIDSLIAIQSIDSDTITLPAYDKSLLQREMNLFPRWFLNEHLAIEAPNFLPQIFDILVNNALEQPQLIVHRDYHSRNLMHTTTHSPGIIDFQDAVIGPISYDLVSLLRDCYISWPEDKINRCICYYFEQAQKLDLLPQISLEQFTRWFDFMGLQRHIKVLGIFCRLNYRDNKPNYIDDLPLTLHYVKQVSAKYPEFFKLHEFLVQQPLIAKIK